MRVSILYAIIPYLNGITFAKEITEIALNLSPQGNEKVLWTPIPRAIIIAPKWNSSLKGEEENAIPTIYDN